MLRNDDVTGMLINPVYAVSINPNLMGKHDDAGQRRTRSSLTNSVPKNGSAVFWRF
jgi:hypothetical protein